MAPSDTRLDAATEAAKEKEKKMNKISKEEIEKLGRYNSEVARGLVHTTECEIVMSQLQQRFDAHSDGLKPGTILPLGILPPGLYTSGKKRSVWNKLTGS